MSAGHSSWKPLARPCCDHFEVGSLDGFGLAGLPLAIRAAGGLLHYLAETQRSKLGQLSTLHAYSTEQFMTLDAATRRNLELTETLRRGAVQGSLLGVLDATVTSMGGRLLRRWLNQPLLDLERLSGAWMRWRLSTTTRRPAPGCVLCSRMSSDLERLASRAVQGIARPRDLLGIRQSLETLPEIQDSVAQMDSEDTFLRSLVALDPARTLLRSSARPSSTIPRPR